jgi:cytochrome c-type biogenesis protein
MALDSLLTLFGAGLLTFASPCVLPMLPIYLSTLGGAGAAEAADEPWRRRRLRRAGLGFALGLGVVFVALGAGASALGASVAAHRQAFALVAGGWMVLLGAKLLGVLRLPWLDRESRPFLDRVVGGGGLWGGALFGAAFAAGWTPCVGPVLGAALTYAAGSNDPLTGMVQLAAYAAGLAAPLVAAAFAAPSAIALSRRLLPATPYLHRATGALVVAAGLLFATGHVGDVAPKAPSATAAPAVPCDGGTTGACEAPSGDVAGPVEPPRGKPRLLEFESAHCTVCARMAPIVEALKERCTKEPDTIVRVRVDDPGGKALAARYGVRFVPTFLGVDDRGEEVERSVGEQPRVALERMLSEVRGEGCAAPL